MVRVKRDGTAPIRLIICLGLGFLQFSISEGYLFVSQVTFHIEEVRGQGLCLSGLVLPGKRSLARDLSFHRLFLFTLGEKT